ncbi:MAG: AbiEi antitoxin N-terminal domain-containing protein, partial [Burkholderiales bacterium]|nr:AbiEi antitoxin N-terminal domain-containing protein [Burkholderiales bacterium]
MPFSENISIRELMTQLEWDRPYSTQDLEAMGMPATNTARLAGSGWLKRLGRGVYKVPNGTLDRDKVLSFLT